jgi:hypothetical protein
MIYDLTQELNRSPVKVIPFRAKNVQQTPTPEKDNYTNFGLIRNSALSK